MRTRMQTHSRKCTHTHTHTHTHTYTHSHTHTHTRTHTHTHTHMRTHTNIHACTHTHTHTHAHTQKHTHHCHKSMQYMGEQDLPIVMHLIDNELSEPYSIFTYRYFLQCWPKLCFLAYDSDR